MHISNISDYRDSVLALVDSMADLTCYWPFRSMVFKWSIQQSTVTEESFQLVSTCKRKRCRSLSSYITQIFVVSFSSCFSRFKFQNVTGVKIFHVKCLALAEKPHSPNQTICQLAKQFNLWGSFTKIYIFVTYSKYIIISCFCINQ